jgi:branched-chain amino acid transport system permease protein
VNTGEFPLTLSIQLLAAMVLGGTGTLIGMVWGGILLVYLPQWSTSLSNSFNLGNGANAYLATIIFGVVLIVAMLTAPNGIQGGLRWLWGHRPRPHGGPRGGPDEVSTDDESNATERKRRSDAKTIVEA